MAFADKEVVEGLAELDKALAELGGQMGYATLRKAGRKAMRPALEAAIAGANEETGELKQSIAISVKKGRGARGKGGDSAAEIMIGATKKAVSVRNADGTRSRKQLNNINAKAGAQEYGTKYQKKEPFLRPALANNVNRILSLLSSELAAELDKAAKKVAK